MIVDVSNKVIVITGASKGIGSELAKRCAQENAKVVINYFQSEKKAKQLYDEIFWCNKNCMIVKADITKPIEVLEMYHEVINEYGRVDVLINNAGILNDSLTQMMSISQWQNVLDVNLTGTFLCCREISKSMIKQKSGKIFNISSLKGQEGAVAQANYAASKAGVIALTKTLAKELGSYNISVNAVCPGFIDTDLNRSYKEKKRIAEKKSLLPIDSSLNDLVNCLIFMMSDRFSGISGRIFNIDSRTN